jgi:hypothetical protein
VKREGQYIADCGEQEGFIAPQRAQRKTILDINELNKGILGTAIEVLSVKR